MWRKIALLFCSVGDGEQGGAKMSDSVAAVALRNGWTKFVPMMNAEPW
jgi:hypothetical protein